MAKRILVIEDNPAHLDLMTYLLGSFGFAVVTATDGLEGIEAIRRERPALVLCDVQLPRVGGFEVARWLKSHPELSPTPLVAVIALAMVGDRERALDAGFDGYIPKPIEPETFVQDVTRFLVDEGRPANAPGPVTSGPAGPATPRATLLVVDDQSINIELARAALEPAGYRVVAAQGLCAALAAARDAAPDLILSDASPAGASAFQLVELVKADPSLRAVPFVFITSTRLADADRQRALQLGAAWYLTRPIRPSVLRAEIEACLSNPGRD